MISFVVLQTVLFLFSSIIEIPPSFEKPTNPAILILATALVVGTEPDPPNATRAFGFHRWRDDLRVVRVWKAAMMRMAVAGC
jgi:hypothetical protein